MNTQIIGVTEFRSHLSDVWHKAQQYNIRFIVMHHGKPVFEVRPAKETPLYYEKNQASSTKNTHRLYRHARYPN